MGNEAIVAAAAGDGNPLKKVCESSSSVSTLNRASRNNAHSENKQAITHKSRDGYSKNGWKRASNRLTPDTSASIECNKRNIRKAGATPKLMASHRLSSSAPKSLVCRAQAGDAAVEHVEEHRQKNQKRRR